MKKLELKQMEVIAGGFNWLGALKDVSCIAATIWPIGTAIAGPTCLGMIIATNQ